MFKFGYIGVVGKTNAGKSTLVNALVGEKVAIVSEKKQTTRENIMGILTKDNYQLVFVDTPGLHRTKNRLDKYMMKNVRSAISGVDVILYVKDCSKPFDEEEIAYVENLTQYAPTIVGLSKVDCSSYEKVYPLISAISGIKEIKAIVPFSSFKHRNLAEIITEILKILPENDTKNFQFDEDMYTDKSLRFIVSEVIREKALYYLDREIPHGIAVMILNYEELDNIVNIDADIVCDKDSHKAIILGKQGSMLKKIGHSARVSIQKIVQKKVNLNIFIKVKPNWKNNLEFLSSLGYNINEI